MGSVGSPRADGYRVAGLLGGAEPSEYLRTSVDSLWGCAPATMIPRDSDGTPKQRELGQTLHQLLIPREYRDMIPELAARHRAKFIVVRH